MLDSKTEVAASQRGGVGRAQAARARIGRGSCSPSKPGEAEAEALAEAPAPGTRRPPLRWSHRDPGAAPGAEGRTRHMPERPPERCRPARVGVLLANLGTPDGTDYRSMRRYLWASSSPTGA